MSAEDMSDEEAPIEVPGEDDEEGDEDHCRCLKEFCESIMCAIFVVPLVLLACCILLGWNEKRSVCDAKALAQGEEEVKEVSCTTLSEEGELVMWSCDVEKSSVPEMSLSGSFATAGTYRVAELVFEAEMMQCIETSKTKKKSGGKSTTTYSYESKWHPVHVDSTGFKKNGNYASVCNSKDNPEWPAEVYKSYQHAESAKAGAWTVMGKELYNLPKKDLDLTTPPAGWSKTEGWYVNTVHSIDTTTRIGEMRVRVRGTDWSKPTLTMLGKNNKGVVEEWKADSSWLCDGNKLFDCRAGKISKDDLFDFKEKANKAVTWLLRFVGFGIMWCAFAKCFGPLEVVADWIPLIGEYIGDAIEAVACIIACPPACACALLVIGIMWVVMRPAVGICLVLLFVVIAAGYVAYSMHTRQKKAKKSEKE